MFSCREVADPPDIATQCPSYPRDMAGFRPRLDISLTPFNPRWGDLASLPPRGVSNRMMHLHLRKPMRDPHPLKQTSTEGNTSEVPRA